MINTESTPSSMPSPSSRLGSLVHLNQLFRLSHEPFEERQSSTLLEQDKKETKGGGKRKVDTERSQVMADGECRKKQR